MLVSASSPQTSLTTQSALNTQGGSADNGGPKANHCLFVTTGAGVSAGVVTLQGSNDGVNWFSTTCIVTVAAANASYAANLQGFPFQYVRALISTAITGGTISAIVASA
jgi:hypothetical protein